MRTERTTRSGGRLALVAVAALLVLPLSVEGQARRGVQQRDTPTRGERQNEARRDQTGGLLLDRFARRAGQALGLDQSQTQRLLRELQQSRVERGRLNASVGGIRAELGRLIQQAPTDEDRVERLMDELFALEVRRAEVAVDEQRRLAEFLTPLQRARVIWLQQRLARQALQQRTDPPIP